MCFSCLLAPMLCNIAVLVRAQVPNRLTYKSYNFPPELLYLDMNSLENRCLISHNELTEKDEINETEINVLIGSWGIRSSVKFFLFVA